MIANFTEWEGGVHPISKSVTSGAILRKKKTFSGQIRKMKLSGGGGGSGGRGSNRGGKHTIDGRIDAMSAPSLALSLPSPSFLRATDLRIRFAIKAASREMKDITQDQQQQLQR